MPLKGGFQIQIRGLFGTRLIDIATTQTSQLKQELLQLFPFQDFYLVQHGKCLINELDPHCPITVLGRLRGGMGPSNKHQTTPPPAEKANKQRRQAPTSPLPELEDASSEEQPTTTMTTDDKLNLIIHQTKAARRESRQLTRTVRSLEQEFASSSSRITQVEDHTTQLQNDIQQLKVDPNSPFDPPSRRPSVDSTAILYPPNSWQKNFALYISAAFQLGIEKLSSSGFNNRKYQIMKRCILLETPLIQRLYSLKTNRHYGLSCVNAPTINGNNTMKHKFM